ncbi:TolC family protein [Longimicrobium sp.]|uniref:TolC family protein n=1 Tax=Longimicrobium sp. TaxID=2029185 RepID=UPI002D11D685|nr:TolC family protein [Longimicrobium sp.]HSU14408.1 TolC family protein [Longimicrobium sp.]
MFDRNGISRWARVAAALVLAATAAPALAAQTGSPSTQPTATAGQPRTITFSDAVRIALQQNGTLRQAVNAAALDTVAVRQQRMQFLPDVRFSTTTSGSYDRAPGTSTGAGSALSRTSTALNAGVSSSYTLYNGGANSANLRAARLQQQAGASDVERTRQSVVFTVVSNYLSLIEGQEQLRVRNETLASAQAQLAQIRAFVDAGRRPIADLYTQQATVAAAQLAVVQARNAVELAKVDLIQTLQLDPRGEYAFQSPPAAAGTSAVAPLDTLLDQAFARRVDLAARQTELSATEQGVRAAKAGRLPTISVSAGYNTSVNSQNDLGVFDQLNQRQGGSVSVGVSLPIFDRGNTAAEVQRAQILQDNARIALENQRQQVGLEVRRAYLDWQAAQQQLAAAEAQLTAAQQSLNATDQRYRAGVGTLVELAQARSVLAQAQSQMVSARYNLVFQRTLVDYYIGELNPDAVGIG